MASSYIYCISAFVVFAIGSIFCVVGFATPYWIVPFNIEAAKRITGIGLWMFCFRNYAIGGSFQYDQETSAKRHDGCYHLFHREMKKFYTSKQHITDWFIALQVTLSLTLLTSFLATLLTMIYLKSCCRGRLHEKKTLFLWVTTGFGFLSAYTCAGVVIFFGYKTIDSWTGMLQESRLYHLGWSYIVSCFAGVIILIGSLLSAIAAIKSRAEQLTKRPTYNRSLQMANLNSRY